MLARFLRPELGLMALFFFVACGGASQEAAGEATDEATAEATAPGGLPVTAPSGPVNEDLAQQGAASFQARGCVACHTIGKGRLVGPDLAGITRRVSFEWFYHMVTNPDSMIQNDSTAKRLLGEFLTPMANQGVTPEDVPALWEHLRSKTEEGVEPQANTGAHSMPMMHSMTDNRGRAKP